MRVRVTVMTTTPNEEFTAFTQEDIVYDDGCSECVDGDAPLAYVNREEPDNVIHEKCLYNLRPRIRDEFIAIKDVPSGELTASEKVDAMVGESLDAEEYELDEPVEVAIHNSEKE